MASRFIQAVGDIVRHLPVARRDPLAALDLVTPPVRGRVLADQPYGPHGGQQLDLYLPDGPPHAGVVFFHGGRWTWGSKAEYRFVAEALVGRGLAVAVCDYRKYPQHRFPAFVEDAAAALAWARRHLPGHGVDAGSIFAMGHSAGAHMAALATMDRRYGATHGNDPDDLAGLVLMSGPYDFFPIRGDDLRDIFGPEEGHAATQPLRFVRPGLPPMLLLHGRRDVTVRPSSSARLASAVREAGGEARLVLYDHLAHTNIVAGLSGRVGFVFAPVLDDVEAFVRARLAA